MRKNRDDFSNLIKEVLAKRVGYLCSNCRKLTVGANEAPSKSTSIGVAAHITAAAPGGPRYKLELSPEERRDITNGIWLCSNCASLIDKDPFQFNVDVLYNLKLNAEDETRQKLGKNPIEISKQFVKLANPILEVDLLGGGRSRSPRGYSDKNPTEMHDGQLVMVPGLNPIIYWALTWRYKLTIINNSKYPAYNVKIESIGNTHFSEIPSLPNVNNIAPFQNMDIDVKFNDWIESDHTIADKIIKPRYPVKFEDLILKLIYQDEDRNVHCSYVRFVQGEILNEKIKD